MSPILSRSYLPSDFTACMGLFYSNTPTFFAPSEREELHAFLSGLPGNPPYLVLVQDGAVIACGGIAVDREGRHASLVWGMVDRALHGRGLGRMLALERLALARATADVAEVRLSTSQHSRGFYERIGFTETGAITNGFGPGLDRIDMLLRLSA